jgi:hypothetical protein
VTGAWRKKLLQSWAQSEIWNLIQVSVILNLEAEASGVAALLVWL